MVYNSIFINNSAENGGAIYQYDDSTVYGFSFINNSAKHGGAIFRDDLSYDDDDNVWDFKESHVYNCTFENNHAEYGWDDICFPGNHPDDNQSDDMIQNSSIDNQYVVNSQNNISSVDSEMNTGNPIGLLIVGLSVLITRIKK